MKLKIVQSHVFTRDWIYLFIYLFQLPLCMLGDFICIVLNSNGGAHMAIGALGEELLTTHFRQWSKVQGPMKLSILIDQEL